MIGKTISHYKIIDKLGEGGMGVVYKAEDTKLKRSVALKFLPSTFSEDKTARERFIHEAQAASALDHPNICNIYEINETDDHQSFIAMACYEGESLKKKIEKGKMKIEDSIEIAVQVAKGLARAHEEGIVHRDIKPANILITSRNEVKIVDFGLAKLSGQTDITKEGSLMGTVAYMSPEQARGEKLDAGTDIWSFGVILYELLTGEPPFKADYDQAVIYSILNENPTPLKEIRPDIPDQLIEIVDRCLKKDRKNRFLSIRDFLETLQQVQQEVSSKSSPYKPLPLRKKIKSQKKYLLLGTILFALILGWIIWKMFFSLPEEKHIAVLPLANIGADEKNKIYCEGLLEIITSRLTQLQQYAGSMWVIPSSEIRKFKITSVEEAYKKFNANLVVTGSIEMRADYMQLILNLVDAKSFRQLKSEDLRIEQSEISSKLEEVVIDKIIDMLELHLHPIVRADFFAGGTHSPNAYDYYVQGRGYLQRYEDQNNIDTSIQLFKKALNVDSLFTLAWAGLGEAYWRKYEATKDITFVEPAMTTCKRAIKQNDHFADVYVTCGMINIGIGKYEEAIQELKRALKTDSLNGVAYWKLGQAYQLIGDSTRALKSYQKAIEKRPGFWQGYSHLGYFYLVNGNYQKAIKPYEKVVELLPQSDLGYSKLAATYFYMNRFSDAVRAGEKAMKNEPSYTSLNNLAGFYYYAGEYAKSADMYREVLRINQNDYKIPGNLASAFYYSGEKDSALVCFQIAVQLAERERKINPRNELLLTALAGYYAELNERDKAYGLLEEVIALKPTEPDIFFNIGDTYEQLGQRDMAIKWMEKAINKGYTMAKFKYNPGLTNLIADERFQKIWEKNKSEY
ncbi:protein kinase [Calditrichota bacterium]